MIWLEAARASPVNYFSFKRQSIVITCTVFNGKPPVGTLYRLECSSRDSALSYLLYVLTRRRGAETRPHGRGGAVRCGAARGSAARRRRGVRRRGAGVAAQASRHGQRCGRLGAGGAAQARRRRRRAWRRRAWRRRARRRRARRRGDRVEDGDVAVEGWAHQA